MTAVQAEKAQLSSLQIPRGIMNADNAGDNLLLALIWSGDRTAKNRAV